MSGGSGLLGRQVRIVGPGFLLGQVPGAFEVQARAQLSKTETQELVDDRLDGGACGRMCGTFNGEGFIGDLPGISCRHAIDEDCPVERAVAWINPLNLMPLY